MTTALSIIVGLIAAALLIAAILGLSRWATKRQLAAKTDPWSDTNQGVASGSYHSTLDGCSGGGDGD